MKIRISSTTSSDRWWDIPSVFLLVVILTAGFTRLIATQWTEGLTITRTLSYLGLAAGLALGYSRFSPGVAGFFALAYGLFFVPWRLGLTMGEGMLWAERLNTLGFRLGTTINQLARQQPVTDNLLFLTLMSALFWIISVHAGYSLTRYGSPWRTVLPTGLAMVVIHSYDAYLTSRVWYLVLYLFVALLLVTRLVYLHRRQYWERTKTYIPPQLGVDFIRVAVAATVILLLFSWTAPALADSLPAAQTAWQKIKRPWDRVRDRFDNAFASLRSSVGVVTDYYGTTLSLGRGNRLSDNTVFQVLAPEDAPAGQKFYWRARVFDVYEDGGWSSTLTNSHNVRPDNFDLLFPAEPERGTNLYTFSITAQTPIATVFTVPQTQWISRPARAELSFNTDGTADLSSLRATPSIQTGETYEVNASLSDVTISQMRQSGFEYPDWVQARYLQLPPEITDRTISLAQSIVADKDNPYDMTAAITAWLRQNIQYSETLTELPRSQEMVDWFLFDSRQGFCNYYATAHVILLRSIGIPARLAVGYAQGEAISQTTRYVVRQRDAHAWPEVYFSGLGWVEFEPTAGQPNISRPLGEVSESANDPNAIDPNDLQRRFAIPDDVPFLPDEGLAGQEANQTSLWSRANLWRLGAAVGLFAILGLILIPFKWKTQLLERLPPIPVLLESGIRRAGLQSPPGLRRWAQRSSLSPLGRAYHEINLALGRLGRPPRAAQTPSERAETLTSALPATEAPAQRLLTEYETATYGNQAPDIQAARQAGVEIRRLSIRAFFKGLLRRPLERGEELTGRLRR